MASPESSVRATGLPCCTIATSEFVVPRSMPTARENPGVHGALTRDWPGSLIWNSASAMVHRLCRLVTRLVVGRHLVEEPPVVAQLDERARDHLEIRLRRGARE